MPDFAVQCGTRLLTIASSKPSLDAIRKAPYSSHISTPISPNCSYSLLRSRISK
jgi:hypothetical protein